MHLSTDNTFHSSGKAVQKSGILLQIGKSAESSDGDGACHMFNLQKTEIHMKNNFITLS